MMLWRWFGVAFGVAESPEGDGPYGSPPGRFFCAYKRDQNTVKGERFPFDEPLSVACSAGYERCKSIVRTAHRYAPKVAAGASAPFPSPSPVAGEGPSGQIAAYSGLRLGSVTFCASLLGQSQSLPPCGARKNHRAARLLDFFDRRISSNPCRSASAFGGTNRSPAPQPPRPAPTPNPLPQGRGPKAKPPNFSGGPWPIHIRF